MNPPVLDGVRVLDLSRVMSGPYCTAMLADLGAEVIKIERPESGDEGRAFGPFDQGVSTYFLQLNRGKKSVTIDLKSKDGVNLIKSLLQECDVLVENFRPGVMKRLGLEYDTLQQEKPNLIYTSISGFGEGSPLAKLPAFDLVIQAMSGMMSLTGQPDGPPTAVGESFADICTGMFASWGILGALFNRERTGAGTHLDISMLDSMISMLTTGLSQQLFFANDPKRVGNRHPITYPVDSFPTQDGDIVLVAFSDAAYESLCQAMGAPELVTDPRFCTNDQRNQNEAELRSIIGHWTEQYPSEIVLKKLQDASVPCAPVLSLKETLASEHVRQRQLIEKGQHKTLGEVPIVRQPVRFSENSVPQNPISPSLGEHTQAVLSDLLDLAPSKLDDLAKKGTISLPSEKK